MSKESGKLKSPVETYSYIVNENHGSNHYIKSSEKISLVYAGLIKKNQVAFRCVEIANYLSGKYIIKIIGKNADE